GTLQEENKEAEENRSEKIPETVNKVIFACDAGMGSSAMGSSLLKNKFKKENLAIEVNNSAINQIPDDADIVITHKNLKEDRKSKIQNACIISINNFLISQKYDEVIIHLLV